MIAAYPAVVPPPPVTVAETVPVAPDAILSALHVATLNQVALVSSRSERPFDTALRLYVAGPIAVGSNPTNSTRSSPAAAVPPPVDIENPAPDGLLAVVLSVPAPIKVGVALVRLARVTIVIVAVLTFVPSVTACVVSLPVQSVVL